MIVYKNKNDFSIRSMTYGFNDGTCKKGWKFVIIKEPTEEYRKYELLQIDTKFPLKLYVRKSELIQLFEEIKAESEVSE